MAIVGDITKLEAIYTTTSDEVAVNPPTGGWLIDFDQLKRVVSYTTDGIDVLKQSVMLALGTERLGNIIYSSDYGQEFNAYFSDQDSDYIVVMLPTLIKNTLLVDDRINSCDVRNIKRSADYLSCDVLLNTIFGDVLVEELEIVL